MMAKTVLTETVLWVSHAGTVAGFRRGEAWLVGSFPQSGEKCALMDTDPATTCLYPSIPSLTCPVFQFCFLSQQILPPYLHPSFWSEYLPTPPPQVVYIHSWVPVFPFPGYFVWCGLQNLLVLPEDFTPHPTASQYLTYGSSRPGLPRLHVIQYASL